MDDTLSVREPNDGIPIKMTASKDQGVTSGRTRVEDASEWGATIPMQLHGNNNPNKKMNHTAWEAITKLSNTSAGQGAQPDNIAKKPQDHPKLYLSAVLMPRKNVAVRSPILSGTAMVRTSNKDALED